MTSLDSYLFVTTVHSASDAIVVSREARHAERNSSRGFQAACAWLLHRRRQPPTSGPRLSAHRSKLRQTSSRRGRGRRAASDASAPRWLCGCQQLLGDWQNQCPRCCVDVIEPHTTDDTGSCDCSERVSVFSVVCRRRIGGLVCWRADEPAEQRR